MDFPKRNTGSAIYCCGSSKIRDEYPKIAEFSIRDLQQWIQDETLANFW
jgi:hypothetical protein